MGVNSFLKISTTGLYCFPVQATATEETVPPKKYSLTKTWIAFGFTKLTYG